MTGSKNKLFYGWIVVAGGFAMAAAGIGIFNNTLSVFVRPVTEALGFSRGSFTFYNTIRSIAAMVSLPLYGELFRRGNVRRIMLVCTLLLGLAPLGYSISSRLWHFYAFAALQGAVMNGVNSMAIALVVNNWFNEKKGLATGVALSGSGLGAAIMVPVVTYVVDTYGWRWGYRLMGITGVLILLPVVLLVMRARPADMGLKPFGDHSDDKTQAAQTEAVGFTRAEVFRMPAFYLLLVGCFLGCFVGGSMQAHSIAYLTDIGHTSLFASSVVSLCMFALIFGKILLGWVFDRFGALVGCLSVSISVIVAGFFLLSAQSPPMAYLFAVVLGYSVSFGSVAPSLITGRYFGTREFSRIYSSVAMMGSLSNAASQPFPGFVYDFTGSYRPAWIMVIALAGVAILIFILADRLMRRAWSRLITQEAQQADSASGNL